jgi:Dynamitin
MKDLILKHDADHAGGGKEVVYSSDGADLPPISFPVKTKHIDIDESELIPPEQAHQIFANKLYAVNPYSNKSASNDATEMQTNESPLVRMARLKNEVEALEKDCASQDFGLFQDPLVKMQEQLQALSSTQLLKQTGLTSSIESSVSALNNIHSVDVKPLAALPLNDGQNAPPLNDRVHRLEKILGGTLGASADQVSLVTRVQALETLLAKLDDKKLDLLQKRSKVIRQDLEAAAKARSKLSSSTIGGTSSLDDSKTITTLYDGLQSLNSMSEHLPILSSRLQALALQHADAATRTARFKAVEQVTSDLSKQVQSIETALSSLDKSMKENATLMQSNIHALEERTKTL